MIFLEYNPTSGISESKSKGIFLTHCTLQDGFPPHFLSVGPVSCKAGRGGFCSLGSPPPPPPAFMTILFIVLSQSAPLLSLERRGKARKEGGRQAGRRLINIQVIEVAS